MRTIKFRAWHRFKKIMFKHVCKIEFSNWNGEEHHLVSVFARNHDEQACLDEAKNWEIMQFTGLKDKNGVEIYEGDIVRWGNSSQYSCGVVIYEGYNFCVSNILHSTDDDRMYFNHSDSFEIIGNVFSNPELLKEGAE